MMFGAVKCKNLTVSRLKEAETDHPSPTFMNTILSEVEEVELLDISIQKELSWTHLVDKMAKDTGKWLGLLNKVSPYLNPNQQAMIYKSMVRSKMEYVSEQECHKPLAHRRQVGALALFHWVHHEDAPSLLNSMLPLLH